MIVLQAQIEGDSRKIVGRAVEGANQWAIMQQSGLSNEEIPKFADPNYWLEYFPPLGRRDVKALGCGVDWRRSFITTDANPFYDSFVRWQFNKLKERGKVIKDKRLSIYSPLDGQVCADHDRSTGEGVGPQEYALVKMRVIDEHLTGALEALKGKGKGVFLGPATLRPETMYGQTNCFVLPEGEYGAFLDKDGDVLIISERAARNLSFQEQLKGSPDKYVCLLRVKGWDLLGIYLQGPNALRERLPVLPMATIAMNKGTGVVTSVPSDAPDDYMAVKDLQNKEGLRKQFGISFDLVKDLEPVPIINVPEFGDQAAAQACEERKVKSINDREAIEEVKHRVYLKGFNEGTMLVGSFKGRKVFEAKNAIKDELLEREEAIPYNEPEKPVVSRSGDECVVALTDQWYITYGEEEWKKQAEECVSSMTLYHDDVRKSFELTLDWLKQWACSRNFGLGSRLPWEPEYLIESLSDSTIYMAYYTVAHLLQGGDLYGKDSPPVSADKVTDEVWDAVFFGKPCPEHFPKELCQRMRREFLYWYPMDLRASGRDLVQNHLTFSVYNHVALFPKQHWPRSFRCNGHVLLNNDKMSKSTGNFLTIDDGVKKYSADAMRFALADAGDGLDDANFEEANANAAILRLTKELNWIEEMMSPQSLNQLRNDSGTLFADRAFSNELNYLANVAYDAYDRFMFREALKSGFFDLMAARDSYRQATASAGMHKDLVKKFIDVATRLLAPVCPHLCEHIWRTVLSQKGSVTKAGWPDVPPPDKALRRAATYLDEQVNGLRRQLLRRKKGTSKPAQVKLFVAKEFVGWQRGVLEGLAEDYTANGGSFSEHSELLTKLKKRSDIFPPGSSEKQVMKQVMPFLRYKQDEAKNIGLNALDVRLPFDEMGVLVENADYISRAIDVGAVNVYDISSEEAKHASQAKVQNAIPGSPAVQFVHNEDFTDTSTSAESSSPGSKNQQSPKSNEPASEKQNPQQKKGEKPKQSVGDDGKRKEREEQNSLAVKVPKGSVAKSALDIFTRIHGADASIEEGSVDTVEMEVVEASGKSKHRGFATALRLMEQRYGAAPKGEPWKTEADELLDSVVLEVCPALDGEHLIGLRKALAVVEGEVGLEQCGKGQGKLCAAEIVLAMSLERSDALLSRAGARPALPAKCAAALSRLWQQVAQDG